MQTADSSNSLASPLELALNPTGSPFASSTITEELIEVAPPRVHYAPLGPGIQQSSGGDLSIVSFDAIDDHLPLGTTDVTFTLYNAGVAPADSFQVDVIYSDDPILGNSDDRVVRRVTIAKIKAQDTLTRTVSVQIPQPLLYQRSRTDTPGNQGEGFVSTGVDYLGIRVDPHNRVIETDEANNVSQIQGVDLDDVSYFPWDINGDGQVDVTDEIFVTDNVGQSVDSTNISADINGNGIVTMREALDVRERIGYLPNSAVSTPTITIDVDTATVVEDVPTISGTITESRKISTLSAGFNDTPVESFVDISDALQTFGPADRITRQANSQTTGHFTLDAARLSELYGEIYGETNGEINDGMLPDGDYTLNLMVTDTTGSQSTLQQTFTLGTQEVHAGCLPDESVLTQGGSYSTDLGLTTSLALPGTRGVDVVMTAGGAIAAVNNDAGSSLYWIDPATGAISQTVNLETGIRDIAFDGDDTLIAVVTNKVVKLSAQSGEILSEIQLQGIDRAAISKNGHVAAISDQTVYLYDTNDNILFSKFLNYVAVTDIEVRSCGDGNDLVYVTSFRNDTFTFLGNTNPVQIARLEAFDFTGDRQWQLFGDAASTIKQNVADTRLYRTTLGQDGYLYIGGESAGTATIFRWRGQPMTEAEQFGSANPFLTRIDPNSQLYNSGSAHISYYARVNPITGQMVTSQLSFPRLSSGKSNTMRIGDIAGSANGILYFGGAANASLRNRDSQTINGQPIGEYSGQDTTWMAIAPNFGNRNFWTALSEESGRGKINGVDAGYGYSAAVSNLKSGTVPVTTGTIESNVYISFITE